MNLVIHAEQTDCEICLVSTHFKGCPQCLTASGSEQRQGSDEFETAIERREPADAPIEDCGNTPARGHPGKRHRGRGGNRTPQLRPQNGQEEARCDGHAKAAALAQLAAQYGVDRTQVRNERWGGYQLHDLIMAWVQEVGGHGRLWPWATAPMTCQ